MFYILNRYIAKIILMTTVMTAFIMTSILFILSLLGEAKNIGTGDYGFLQSVIYVFLRLPNEIYHFFPLYLLLGSIIGLSLLSNNRELIVMRTAGFSYAKIISSVLLAVFLITSLVSLLGEYIAPSLSYKAVVRKENAQNAGEAVVTASGIWLHLNNNFIHVQEVIGKHLLRGITRYEFDDEHKLKTVFYIANLMYVDHHWQMRYGLKTSFSPERTKSEAFIEQPWDLRLNLNLLKAGMVDPSDMSLTRLAEFSRYLHKNGLHASEYEFNFWQRLFQPLASLVMIFLGVLFVLNGFSSLNMGLRIMLGIFMGFAFYILNALFGQLCIVYQIPAYAAAIIPTFLFASGGLICLKRM